MISFIKNRFCKHRNCIKIAAESHVGCVRKNNEDSFVFVNNRGDINALVVVCDGIGGHSHGEIASQMCCNVFVENWNKHKVGLRTDKSDIQSFMGWLVEQANTTIREENAKLKLERPMGCTVVAAVITPDSIIVAHAGDSRCYGHNNSNLAQLTTDHTLRALMLAKSCNNLSEAELPPSNVISKAVGPCSVVRPTVGIFERSKFCKLLLCSDGLSGVLDDQEIDEVLAHSSSPEMVVDELIRGTLKRGAHDNVTCISVFC